MRAANIHLFSPLRSGDIVRLLPTRKGGTNLRAGHGLEGISGRGLKVLQLPNLKFSEVMCLCPDLRKYILPAQVLELISGNLS